MQVGKIDIRQNPTNWTVGSAKEANEPTKTFGDVLRDSVNNVKQLHAEDERNTELLAVGDADNLHKIMIDADKADIALQLMLQTRNKALEAYQEIMRMQI